MSSKKDIGKAKTLGECPTCGNYGSLTMHHISGAPGGYKMPLCEPCHKIVTRYEDEMDKALKYLDEG